jgi:nitrogen fixation/metabolism regulation signal transduction histidine kinase
MKTNRYYFTIIIRIILITLNCFILIWFFTETSRPATTLFFLLLLIIQAASLIIYLNRINRDLANFLIYLQENDTSLVFSRNRVERNFKNIMTSLNEINQKIHEARLSREEKHQYLKAVVDHLDTGIFSFNRNGKIELVNKAALAIFGLRTFSEVEMLYRKYPPIAELINNPSVYSDSPVKIHSGGKTLDLSIKTKELKIGNEKFKIVSCQNIKPELEERELESWKKFIRVLRHEIMNSITPITTLTLAIKRCFSGNDKQKMPDEITGSDIEVALSAVEVIEERSKGLINFVEKFKSITDLPKPINRVFPISEMFEKIRVLFQSVLYEKKIQLIIKPNGCLVRADEQLIEQVMINLLKNAVEAINSDGEIVLEAFGKGNTTFIRVIDSGQGIEPENLENIFVPSFSTKENGLGVGLSISRQIIQLHHGQISVESQPGFGSTFEIRL